MTMTDALNEALDSYLSRLKSDFFFHLTASVENATEEESREILGVIDSTTDDDLFIGSVKRFTV